jgi:hypothetical protein
VLLSIPHANYELAVWRQLPGVASLSFVPEEGRLVLGNELLGKMIAGYQHEKRYRVRQHTVSAVIALMSGRFLTRVSKGGEAVVRPAPVNMPLGFDAPREVKTAAGVVVGYLMLDALVATQDRHHENWGLVVSPDGEITLAPTFDHASSLGRNEQDEQRIARLATKDPGFSIERYAEKARSALFAGPASGKALTTLEAFIEATKLVPEAGIYWLHRLEHTNLADYARIFDNVPPQLITPPARDFALKMLEANRHRLLEAKKSISL